MGKFGNAAKAICLVLGGLALLGLVILLSPILAGIGGLLLGLLEVLLPVIVIVAVIVILYKYFESRKTY